MGNYTGYATKYALDIFSYEKGGIGKLYHPLVDS